MSGCLLRGGAVLAQPGERDCVEGRSPIARARGDRQYARCAPQHAFSCTASCKKTMSSSMVQSIALQRIVNV